MYRVNRPCSSQSRLLTATWGAGSPSPGMASAPGPSAQDQAAAWGQGCTARMQPAPARLWAEHPGGWSPPCFCTTGCSMNLSQHQSVASYPELCSCRAARGEGILARGYSIHPVTTRAMG